MDEAEIVKTIDKDVYADLVRVLTVYKNEVGEQKVKEMVSNVVQGGQEQRRQQQVEEQKRGPQEGYREMDEETKKAIVEVREAARKFEITNQDIKKLTQAMQ